MHCSFCNNYIEDAGDQRYTRTTYDGQTVDENGRQDNAGTLVLICVECSTEIKCSCLAEYGGVIDGTTIEKTVGHYGYCALYSHEVSGY